MDEIHAKVVHAIVPNKQASLLAYAQGFITSVILTLWAYIATIRHLWTHAVLVAALLVLAVLQFIVQVYFFLHIGHDTKPRWKSLLLIMMIVFVLILVVGSVWVMQSLNQRMTPQQMNTYMLKQDGGI